MDVRLKIPLLCCSECRRHFVARRNLLQSKILKCVCAETWDDSGNSHGVVYKRTRWRKPAVLSLDQTGAGDTYVLFFDAASGDFLRLKTAQTLAIKSSWALDGTIRVAPLLDLRT